MAYFLAFSAALVALVLAIPAVLGLYWTFQLSLTFLYAIVAIGIGICWGQGGFLPLGQGMFLGLGAYMSGLILVNYSGSAIIWLLLPAAAIVPAVLAWGIGLAVFRGRTESGPFFALITLALTLLAFQIANTWNDVTGGFNGLRNIPDLPGMDGYDARYYFAAGALVAALGLAAWLINAPLGVVWRALAQNERRIVFFGYSTTHLKATAFAVAGFLAGFAGLLYAPQQNLVTPTLSGFLISADLVIWTAVGGRRSVIGPPVGAILIGVLTTELRDRVTVWEVFVSLVFILVVLYLPNGLVGMLAPLQRRLAALAARRPKPVEAPPPAHGGLAAPALGVDGCHLSVGDVHILDGLSLALEAPSIYCLIGPNGAGKTSTFNTITGELKSQSGDIRFDGVALGALPPERIAKLGIGRKFQIPSVFTELSVRDNIHVALWGTRARFLDLLKPSLRRWQTPVLAQLRQRYPFLENDAEMAGNLSHGERQILELAMSLVAEPRLLLLDEPCAGMSAEDSQIVIDTIHWARQTLGLTVVVIEHDMALVREIADHIFVMHQGSLLAQGDVASIQADTRVRDVYVGITV